MIYIYKPKKLNEKGELIKDTGFNLANALNSGLNGIDNILTSFSSEILPGSIILNYGNSKIPSWYHSAIDSNCTLLNNPHSILNSVDKRKSLLKLSAHNIPTLDFTFNEDIAREWLNLGHRVIARTIINGSNGKGVVILKNASELIYAPLYTLLFKKTHEFRVHVISGRVVDYSQKKKMSKEKLEKISLEEADKDIRNNSKGWVFSHNNILIFDQIKSVAIRAINTLSLDMGAVDILARVSKDGKLLEYQVCEVNSAPGISNTITFNNYINEIKKLEK